jgi:hypothetical protein
MQQVRTSSVTLWPVGNNKHARKCAQSITLGLSLSCCLLALNSWIFGKTCWKYVLKCAFFAFYKKHERFICILATDVQYIMINTQWTSIYRISSVCLANGEILQYTLCHVVHKILSLFATWFTRYSLSLPRGSQYTLSLCHVIRNIRGLSKN